MEIKELDKIKLITMVLSDPMWPSDAVVCLEGDGKDRINKTINLFGQKLAKKIVISGGYNNPPFSLPAKYLVKYLMKRGVLRKNIILEENSQNTYEQGMEVMKIVKKNKWNDIILIASPFHQARAYLTFLKAMKDSGLKIRILNAPVRGLSWFDKTSLNLSRLQLLEEEFKKIKEYARKGHIATIEEAIKYQKWKERKLKK